MPSFRLLTVGLALALASSTLALQQPTPKPPVFASGTGVVLVDLVVIDKSDRLVGGLKAQDFVVREDGKERPIVSFTAVARAQAREAGPADVVVDSAPKAAPAGNEAVTTVLFVDDTQLRPQEVVRLGPALKKLVETIGEQKGVLALVAPGSGIQMADEAAGNRALFGAAIDKIVGQRMDDRSAFPLSDAEAIQAEQGDTAVLERVASRFVYLNRGIVKFDMAMIQARGRAIEVAAKARIRRGYAYDVLLKSLDWLATKPGRHSVVIVSGGYATDPQDKKQEAVVTRSLQANAPIHFLDARGLQGVSRYLGVDVRNAVEYDGMESATEFADAAAATSGLADDTGGLYIRNTNDMLKGINQILDMNSTYYVLGYEAPEHTKPGFRKIKVEVAKGLKVISRRGYYDEAVAPR